MSYKDITFFNEGCISPSLILVLKCSMLVLGHCYEGKFSMSFVFGPCSK